LYQKGQQTLSVKYNMPLWWIQKLQKDYPEQWENIIIESHKTPKMTLRVNPLQYDPKTYQDLLQKQGIHSHLLGESGLMLEQAVPVHSLPDFEQGACFVQDWGAQMAGNILINLAKQNHPNAIKETIPQNTSPTLRILDACAAPGGKTTHLLEHLHTSLDVIDVSADRLQRVQDNLDRLKISQQHLRLINTDAREKTPWFTAPYDFILADVPCTASGVIRRHPDIQYLRQPSDISQTVQLQREIIQNLWHLLKENGYFLYITCSIFQEEGENQVQWMLEHCSQIKRLNCVGQLLPTQTDTMSHDGFFIALLQKTTCNQ
nr:16S rRNA (cytosine(967)-C(5))-methyltransferase RsmB [Alcaligenaceae bacterium]